MRCGAFVLLLCSILCQQGYAYKFEDLDTGSAVSSKKKDDIKTNAFEIKDEDEVPKDVRNNDFEDQNEEKNINQKAQDKSDLNNDDDQTDDKDQKNTILEYQNDLEDENNLPNDPSDRDNLDANNTELPLDDNEEEEETIEESKETYNPKDFEDKEEYRTDWMRPETSSSDDFVDETEFADMPYKKQELDEFESQEDGPENEEKLNSNSPNDANVDEEQSKEVRTLAKKDPLFFKRIVRRVSRGVRRTVRRVSRGVRRAARRVHRGVRRAVRRAHRSVRRAVRRVSRGVRKAVRRAHRGVRRAVRRVHRGVRRAVRRVSRGVRRVIRNSRRHFRRIGKTLRGATRLIARSDVGRYFGKIAKKAFGFLKCAVPGLENIDHCVKDAIRSVGSCTSGSRSCRMKIGGKRSKCLSFSFNKSYRKSYGPATFTGYVKPSIGLGVEAYLNTGKIAVTLDGSVKINSKLLIKVQRSNRRTYQKRIPLTRHPKRIFQKLIIVAIGAAPVPVLVEVTVQPVARLTLTTSASGSFEASITLKKDARIALDNARVEYEPERGLPKFSSRFSNNFNNLQIQKMVVLQGSATLSGSINIGVEIVVSVNGVPLKMFPSIQFKLSGKLSGTTNNGGCVKGSLTLSTNLKMLVIPDVKRFTSVSVNFKKACRLTVDAACAVGGKALGCFHKSFNPCKTMRDGCNEFGKALEVIPNPIQKNPTLASFGLSKNQYSVWRFKSMCRRG